MLKETENEKQDFLSHFFTNGISIGGAAPLGYAYNYCNFNAICDINLCAFLIVCPCVYVKAAIMVLFCLVMLNM